MMKYRDYFDEILLASLIVIFLIAWYLTKIDKIYELCFGTLTALLGILRGKYRAATTEEGK
jgi:hypothetical protein